MHPSFKSKQNRRRAHETLPLFPVEQSGVSLKPGKKQKQPCSMERFRRSVEAEVQSTEVPELV